MISRRPSPARARFGVFTYGIRAGACSLFLLVGQTGCKRQAQEVNLQIVEARQELATMREDLQRTNTEIDDLTKAIGPRAAALKIGRAITDNEETVSRLERSAAGLKSELQPLQDQLARLEKELADYQAAYMK